MPFIVSKSENAKFPRLELLRRLQRSSQNIKKENNLCLIRSCPGVVNSTLGNKKDVIIMDNVANVMFVKGNQE
jgi:hypothetical protein